MNITFIASLKSYTTAISLIQSLKALRNNVTVLSDVKSDFIEVDGIVEQNFNINELINNKNILTDLIFFCEGGSMKLFPQGLEKVECKTAWYGIDTHMDLQKHTEIAKFFDITFLAQKEYIKYFFEKGLINTFWLPLAYDSSMAPKHKLERIYDIAYVGSTNKDMHPLRFKLIEKLKNEFPNSYFGTASGEEMYKIYSQSKIVFNKSVNNDINMRYFEAMGSGAMLLTDGVINNGMEDIFKKDRHYIEYDELNIIDLAKNYLNNSKDESHMLEAFILQNHTYDIRALNVLEIVEKSQKNTKSLSQIDYAKVYLMLENFLAFLDTVDAVIRQNIVQNKIKRKVVFLPLTLLLKVTMFVLKKLEK